MSETYPDIEKDPSQHEFLNVPLTIQELHAAIDSSHKSSPGPDGINKVLIEKAHEHLHDVLLNMYNYIWEKGELPKSWHHAIIVPIPKPGKDKSSPKGYRPVSLTCTLCKIMERMINNRLIWFLEKI